MDATRSITSFEDLECWKACRELRLFVTRKVFPLLPPDERFEMRFQLRKAIRSGTANIAEGYGRFHYLDNRKFCSNSRGSCWETLDHLITCRDDGYISTDLLEEGRGLVVHAIKLVNGYMSYLKRASGECADRDA